MRSKALLSNLRISTKLLLMNLMICAAFFLIVCVVAFSFTTVWNKVTEVANRDMGRAISNSQTVREISKVFTDIDLLNRTFYGENDYLKSEGGKLVSSVNNISESTTDPDLKKPLLSLQNHIESFLSQCVVVNTVLDARESIDRETHAELTSLENLIAELLVNFTIKGEDTAFVEQLLTLAIGYRESLLQIGKLYAELGHEHYFIPLEGKTSPVIAVIDDLILRLQTISASIPDVARYGEKIVNNVQKYREVVLIFYEAMEKLGSRMTEINHSKTLLMSAMENIEEKITSATQLVIKNIENTILSSGAAVLMASIFVVALLGFGTAYMIKSTINNPMQAILEGVESFRKGNFDKQIELSRGDEWDTIEKGLNNMAADLLKSYTSLRESEERYRALVGAIPDPVVVYDPEGRATYVNDAFEQVYGWSRQELLGDRIDFVPPEEAEATQDAWRRTFQDGTVFFETKRWNNNGDLLDIQLRTAILHDQEGKHTLSIVIHRDVTTLKQAEKELRESQINLQTLFNSVDDFLFVLDMEGYIMQVNPIVLKRLGYPESELLGEHVLKVHPPDRHEEGVAIIADMVAGKIESCPIPLMEKDGTQIPVETKVSQGRWGDHDVFFGVSRDITERIQAEKELRESKYKFHSLFDLSPQAIALTEVDTGKLIDVNNKFCELTKYSKKEVIGLTTTEVGFYSEEDRNRFIKELQASGEVSGLEMGFKPKDGSILHVLMSAKIIEIADAPFILTIFLDVTEQKRLEVQLQQSQKLEAIGILAGGIAHDFNNLLSVIMGNITLVEDDVKPEVGISEYLKEALKASLKAQELTKQLITFSKGGAPIKKVGSIGGLVKETTNSVLSDSNVKCEFLLPHDLWLVELDDGQMNHAVKNMIENAVESMPGGGSIDVRSENFEISSETIKSSLPLAEGKYVKISIQDNGVGIPKEHLPIIFDPYFSTKERGTQKGMGMGLAITYSIINRHDGHITVESEEGVGTTFSLYLPAHEKVVREIEHVEAPPPEKPAILTGRILLMDDEEMVRSLGKQMLSRLGFDTELAKDGAEAIELYKIAKDLGKPYDAVILDLTVKGGMSGKDAVKRLLEIDPQVKAIISSGYFNDPVMADFKKYGFIGALPKPYTMKDLIDALNSFS